MLQLAIQIRTLEIMQFKIQSLSGRRKPKFSLNNWKVLK